MKKLLFVFLLTAVTMFTGCLIDNDDDNIDSPLNSTTWKHAVSETENKGVTETTVVKFAEDTFEMVTTFIKDKEIEVDTVIGTYTYDLPTVKLTARGKVLIGEIHSNKMTFDEGVFTQLLSQ